MRCRAARRLRLNLKTKRAETVIYQRSILNRLQMKHQVMNPDNNLRATVNKRKSPLQTTDETSPKTAVKRQIITTTLVERKISSLTKWRWTVMTFWSSHSGTR